MAVATETFRELFGSYPTAVSIVTSVDSGGEPRGFTCNAFSAVSAGPPLLMVCVDKRSQTLPALLGSRAFVVNVLAEGGEEASQIFAGRSDRKFDGLDWYPSAAAGGAPVLRGITLAHAECTVVQTVEAGDHWIVIGRIEGAQVFQRRPLLYHQRSYTAWEQRCDSLPQLSLAGARAATPR